MAGVTKLERPRYDPQILPDKVRDQTKIYIGDVFENWRRVKVEKNICLLGS